MEDNKNYIVTLPTGQSFQLTPDEYNQRKDAIFDKYQDAQAVLVNPMGEDMEVDDNSAYLVNIPDGGNFAISGASYKARRDAISAKGGTVQSLSPVDYWGEQYEAINARRSEIEARKSELSDIIARKPENSGLMHNVLQSATPEEVELADLEEENKALMTRREANPVYRELTGQNIAHLKGRSSVVEGMLRKYIEEHPTVFAMFNASVGRTPMAGVSLPAVDPAEQKKGEDVYGDYQAIRAAQNLYHDALETAKAPSKYDKSKTGFGNFLRGGVARADDILSLLEADQSLTEAGAISKIVKKIQAATGDEKADLLAVYNDLNNVSYLSDAQKLVLSAFVDKTKIDAMRSGDMSIGYKAGQGAMDSVGFALDFLAMGGLGSAVSGKVVGSAADDVAKTAARGLFKKTADMSAETLGQKAVKLGAETGVKFMEAGIKTAVMTPFMPSAYTNLANSLLAVEYGEDMDGNTTISVDMSAKAVRKAIGDVLIENLSENAGTIFDPLTDLGQNAVGFALEKVGFKDFARLMNNSAVNRKLREAAWNGYVGEILEEWFGNSIRVLTGVDKEALRDFIDKDNGYENLLVTHLSFAPMTVFGTGSSLVQLGAAKGDMRRAGEKFSKALAKQGMSEEQIASVLNVVQAETAEGVANNIMPFAKQIARDFGMASQEHLAAVRYARAVSRYNTISEIEAGKADALRTEARNTIDERFGLNRWYMTEEVDGQQIEKVRFITRNGKDYFVVGAEETGDGRRLAIIDMDGRPSFIMESEISEGEDYDSRELSMNDFLDMSITESKEIREREEAIEAEKQRRARVRAASQQGMKLSFGTATEQVTGTVVEWKGDRCMVQMSDGGIAVKSLDEVADVLNVARQETDKEISDAEQKRLERSHEVEEKVSMFIAFGYNVPAGNGVLKGYKPDSVRKLDGQEVITAIVYDPATGQSEESNVSVDYLYKKAEEIDIAEGYVKPQVVDDAPAVNEDAVDETSEAMADDTPVVEPDWHDELPRRKNSVTGEDAVDERKLLNENPVLFAKWYDETHGEGAAQSFFTDKIKVLVKMNEADLKAIAKEERGAYDMDKIDKLRADISKRQKTADGYQSIVDDYARAEQARKEAEKQAKAKAREAEKKARQQARLDLKRAKMMNEEPQSIEELAAAMLANIGKNHGINRESLQKHTGWGNKELNRFWPWFAKKGQGMSMEALGEELVSWDWSLNGGTGIVDNSNAGWLKGDSIEGMNVVLSIFQGAGSPKDISGLIRYNREEQRREMEEYAADFEQREAYYQEHYGMSYEEYKELERQWGAEKRARQSRDTENNVEIEATSTVESSPYVSRIREWLSEDNLAWARGKTRDEIFEHFGNVLEPVSDMPKAYLPLFGEGVTDAEVYSGRGYFIEHAVNHHPNIPVDAYDNIQQVLNAPDAIKSTKSGSIAFIKKLDKYNTVVVNSELDENGRILLHKTFFTQKNEPYVREPDVRLVDEPRVDGIPTISPAEAAAINLDSHRDEVSSEDKVNENERENKAFEEKVAENADTAARLKASPVIKAAEEAIAEWESVLGVSVERIYSIDEIQSDKVRKGVLESGATAWIDVKTGKVYIYMPSLELVKNPRQEVAVNIFHEVVAHSGIRALFRNDEVAYGELCGKVWERMADKHKAHFLDYATRSKPSASEEELVRIAADEYMANISESGLFREQPGVFRAIIDAVRLFLIRHGLVRNVTEADVEALLRESFDTLARRKENGAAGEQALENAPETGTVRFSDEVDENGRQFILTSEGKVEFGMIGDETGLMPAPILLSEGMITNPQTNDGYGLVHIEARHGEQIRKAGYKDVVSFIEEVAKNWDVIREGSLRNGVQTYRLQLTDRHNNTLMVELSGDGTYWNINTAGIFKKSYGANSREVYNRHTTNEQPAETVEESQGSEQSSTQEPSSINSPKPSPDDKGNENQEENKGSFENYIDSIEVKDAKYPKDAQGAIVKKQKSGKRVDSETVSAVLVGNDLYLKTSRYRAEVVIPGARRYGADDIALRIDLGIGVSTDAARMLGDAVRELWQREGLPLTSAYRPATALRNPVPRPQEKKSSHGRDLSVFDRLIGDSKSDVSIDRDSIQENVRATASAASEKKTESAANVDSQGNPVDSDGKLLTEKISSIDELTDEDFTNPTRNVELPELPQNVAEAIGSNGKPVVIKKSIFEKNAKNHKELTAEDSRRILNAALYNPNLVGQTQPKTRPDYKVAIQTGDKNSVVVLDVYQAKDNVEVVGWRMVDQSGLERMKKQAECEGGQFLILSPDSGSAAALSALPNGLSSESKGNENQEENKGTEEKTTANQNEVVTTKKKPKKKGIKLSKYLDKDQTRHTSGIFYENGYAVASDSFVLVADRQLYEAEKEGKLYDAKGNEIFTIKGPSGRKYPNWTVLLNNKSNRSQGAIAVMSAAMDDIASAYEKRVEEEAYIRPEDNEKDRKKKLKEANTRLRNAYVELLMPEGVNLKVNYYNLKLFVDATNHIGAVDLQFTDRKQAIEASSDNGYAIVVQVNERGASPLASIDLTKCPVVKNEPSILYEFTDERVEELSGQQKETTKVVLDLIKDAGIEVSMDEQEMIEALGDGVQLQAQMSKLEKAANTIREWLRNGTRGKSFEIELPQYVLNKVRAEMGRDFDTHNITSNSLSHILKEHGVNGTKTDETKIPITSKDLELIPYIMTAPDKIQRGNMDNIGRESVRFYKMLSNGYVVVVEKEQKSSPTDMETITMWAELSSSNVSDARTNVRPLNSTSQPAITAHGGKSLDKTTARTVIISSDDIAKIQQDAQKAIAQDKLMQFMTVFHGSGASFKQFDHSYIGTGEGAQAYGWGSYVTEVDGIGRMYADSYGGREIRRRINEIAFHIKSKKDFINTRKHSIKKNEDYEKYAYAIRKNIRSSEKELKAARKTGDERYIAFYEDLIKISESQLKPENHKNLIDSFWDDINTAQSEIDKSNAEIKEKKKELKNVLRFLYTVEVPDNNGENYLSWIGRADALLDRVGISVEEYEKEDLASGADVYTYLSRKLGSDKAASEFLSSCGFVGIEYPAQSMSGGRADNAKNYVIFNESDLKIIDRTQFLKTAKGEALGFVKGGKIYLDPKQLNPNTPIHEYTHLWDMALQKANPELWKRGVELMKQLPLWEEIKNNPAYADISGDENLLASEIHARLTGEQGAALMEQMIADVKGEDILAQSERASLVHRLRSWIKEVWLWLRDTMSPWTAKEASEISLDDFIKMPVKDLVEGKKLNDYIYNTNTPTQYSIRTKPTPNSADKVLEVFNDVVNNNTTDRKPIRFGTLTTDGLEYLRRLTGWNFKNSTSFVLNASDLKHIYNNHFGENEKDKGNNIPLTENDIRSIVDVISHPDDIVFFEDEKQNGRKTMYFLKADSNGTYNLCEVISSKRGTLTAKTLYKTKRAATQRVMDLKQSLLPTSETYFGASSLVDAKIPQLFDITITTNEDYRNNDLDREYLDAVNRGDMETAQRMVNEAAAKAGYNEDSDYQGTSAFNGAAPSNDGYYDTKGERIEAIKADEIEGTVTLGDLLDVPDGFIIGGLEDFAALQLRIGSTLSKASARNILNTIRKGKRTITMYRSVPADVEENSFRNGDWITPSREYAIDNAEIHGFESYRIIEQEVDVDDVWWDGNDINEWGYDDGSGYAYQNTANNRKLLDAVTYDDNGDVIPLSKRFDSSNSDIRYRLKSDRREKRDKVNRSIDSASALLLGSLSEARSYRRKWEREHRKLAVDIYERVLQSDFNDVTLRKINDYIDEFTPNNPYGRHISQRLPSEVERGLSEVNRTNAVDALFSRIAESAVQAYGKPLAERTREITQVKNRLLEGWARATGHWHTEVTDFTDDREPIGSGKDSDVYYSKDGESVIKVSKGKSDRRKFVSDIDAVAIYNSVFPETKYEILGYGEIDGKFVKFLRQPLIRFDSSSLVTEKERVELMRSLGFEPENKENTVFSNGKVVVSYVQKGNIVRDVNGKLFVIDADAKLHTRDIGGEYEYPAADTDTELRYHLTHIQDIESVSRENDAAVDEVNRMFNEELQKQIDGTLPKGHTYRLGMPSAILRSAGVANLPIELSSKRLYDKSNQSNHPFSINNLTNLPKAINNPIAVFDSKTKEGSMVILTELQQDGNNFVVVLRVRQSQNGLDVDVNDIRSLYPKDSVGGIVSWIQGGLLRYADKKKITDFITQSTNLIGGDNVGNSETIQFVTALQNHPGTDIATEELVSATKIINGFENPTLESRNQRALDEMEDDGLRFHLNPNDAETARLAAEWKVSSRLAGEMHGIKSKAVADGTFLKAPNGADSKLNERNWLLVRTKEFKRWFGDWEKALRIEKLRDSLSVSISGNEFNMGDTPKVSRKNALEYGKALRGEYVNRDTGEKVIVNKASIIEVLHHDGSNEMHIKSVAAIPDMISNAIYIDSEPVGEASQRMRNASKVDYYVCGLEIGGEKYTTKLVFATLTNGDVYYDHSLTEIEKGELLNRAELSSTVADSSNAFVSQLKDKRLFAILQNISSKVVDENGEPLVVYRGTPMKMGYMFEYGHNFYGGNFGFWFTNALSAAKDYAFNDITGETGDVKEVFLKASSIVDLVALKRRTTSKEFNRYLRENYGLDIGRGSGKEFSVSDLYEKNQDAILNLGYDGVKLADVAHTYIVKNPDQIKSASQNESVSDDADIRYRISYSQSAGAKRYAAETTANRLGVRVLMVSRDEMPQGHRLSRGIYRNGRIYVCLGNHYDNADVAKTVLHEGIGHLGLRRLIGDADMDAFTNEIYRMLPAAERRKIAAAAIRGGGRFSEATEEYLAELAEGIDLNDEKQLTLWDRIRELLRGVLAKAGITVPLSRNEAMFILWQSAHANNDTDLMVQARRYSLKGRLGLSYREQQLRTRQMDIIRDREADDRLSAARAYNKEVSNAVNRLHEVWVDKDNAVGALVEAVEKSSGKKREAYEDVMAALNQQSSKGLAAMEKWERKFYRPLTAAVKSLMEKAGVSLADVERYVMLKHGMERNVVLAKRDAIEFHEGAYRKALQRIENMDEEEYKERQRENLKAALNQEYSDYAAKLASSELSAETRRKKLSDKREELNRKLSEGIIEIDGNDFKDVQDALRKNAEEKLKKSITKVEKGTDGVFRRLRQNDYSGLTSLFSEYDEIEPYNPAAESEEEYQRRVLSSRHPMYETLAGAEDAAKVEVEDFEGMGGTLTGDLWEKINAATKDTLRHQYEANMIGRDLYMKLAGTKEQKPMFEYYVPLRGFKDTTAADMYDYYMADHSTNYSKPVLGAKGRTTEADSPFGYIGAMASSAIASDTKNQSKLALYYFLSQRPNDLVTISDTWFISDGVTPDGKTVWAPAYPDLSGSMSPKEAQEAYKRWEEEMEAKRGRGEARKGRNSFRGLDYVIKMSEDEKNSHIIKFKVGGRDMMMFINGNPRAAHAINGRLNVELSGDYQKVFGRFLRWFSGINTSYNPEFWMSNMQRDILMSALSMGTKDAALTGEWRRAFGWAVRNLHKTSRAYKGGTMGSSEMEGYYREFVENGAVTGYTALRGNDEWEQEIRKAVGDEKKGLMLIRDAFEKFAEFGESVEQMTRFSAYVASRRAGKDIVSSVSDAKELTVNFNRKGSGQAITWEEADKLRSSEGKKLSTLQKALVVGASWIPAYGRRFIMFFNASVQGLNTIYRLAKRDGRKVAGYASIYAALGAVNAVVHSLLAGIGGGDDDEYLSIPEYERRTNAMLGLNGVYLKWALPQEMRMFYGLGDLAANKAMGKSPDKDAADVMWEIVKSFLDVAPVNPSEGIAALAPSAASPFVEVLLNRDFTGARIHDEMRFMGNDEKESTPKYTRAYNGTGRIYVALSQLANTVSGGDYAYAGWLNFHPGNLEHIVEGMTGGAGTTVSKFFTGVSGLMGSAIEEFTGLPATDTMGEWQVRNTPFLRRILVLNDERYRDSHVNDLFYHYRKEANEVEMRLKKYSKAGDLDKYEKLSESGDYQMMQVFNSYKPMIDYYNEALKLADTDKEKKSLMREQDSYRKEMIREISRIR